MPCVARAGAVVTALALPLAAGTAEESICERPLCAFDSRTQRCTVSRSYAGDVLEAYAGGVWRDVAVQLNACETAGRNSSAACMAKANWHVDLTGRCTATPTWAAEKLARPAEQGGAGLGGAECGILGELLRGSAACLPAGEGPGGGEGTCGAASSTVGSAACAFNWGKGHCSTPVLAVLATLRRDYRDELATLAFRRAGCSTRTETACRGGCRWASGRCTLSPMEVLLELTGDACPLRTLLTRHGRCNATDAAVCEAVGADALPYCYWAEGERCEAHPVSLELDFLLALGVRNGKIGELVRGAYRQCYELDAGRCEYECAPGILTGAARGQGFSLVAVVLALLASWRPFS